VADDQYEREIRAARNQSMFRAINEKMREVNAAFGAASETFVIACECADVACVETLDIKPAEYEAIRREPDEFAVRTGHLYLDVEDVVEERPGYTVVRKKAAGADFAEAADPRSLWQPDD